MIRLTLPRILVLFAALMIALVLIRPLLPVDETRYLSVAWEMHLTGDYLHLTKNFSSYTHKPPLLFWVINLVWMLTGVSELFGRLAGPAFGLGAIAATYGLAARLWPGERRLAIAAAAILAGFLPFQVYGSATMFDTMLMVATVGGIGALWRIGEGQTAGQGRAAGQGRRGGYRAWALYGAMLALGAYAKGPVILIHLLPPLLAIRFWAPDCPPWRDILKGFALALALALALVGLWLLPALMTMDAAARDDLLWTQSASRIGGGMAHDRPVWALLVALPVLLFPWAYVAGFWSGLPRRLNTDGALRLCLVWAASGLVLFSLMSSKQMHYLLPELPAVALLVAQPLSVPGRARSLAPWLMVGIGLLFAFFAWQGVFAPYSQPDLAGMTPVQLLVLGAAVAGLGLVARRMDLLAGHLLMAMGLTLGVHLGLMAAGSFDKYDSRRMAALLSPGADGDLAHFGGIYNAEVNFTMRLKKPVALPKSVPALVAWAVEHPQGLVFGSIWEVPIPLTPPAQVHFAGEDVGVWTAAQALSARE